MSAIKLERFGGMLPAWDDRLLPEGQAALSVNCYPFSGALIGWRQPKLLHTLLSGTTKFAYRVPNKTTNNTAITAADSFWMEFDDADTNVVRSPVVNDSFDRYYFASPSVVPKYNTYDRIVAGQPPWLLGVPSSDCAPGVDVTGGGDTSQLGFPTGSGVTLYVGGNQVALVPVISGGGWSVNDVAFIAESTNPTVNITGVVYSDNAGKPFELLASTSQQVTGITAGSQVTLAFDNPIGIDPNLQYWVGFMCDQQIAVQSGQHAGVSGTHSALANVTYTNGAPQFLSGVLTGVTDYNIWIDVTGDSVFEARSYVYTWVSAYGEEGPPSLPTLVNGWSNATWTINVFCPTPDNLQPGGTQRNLTKTRIYRSVSSNTGLSSYFFVAEIPILQASYVDTFDDATVAQNVQLESIFWFPPPSDLKGFTAFPNGVVVGFKSKEVWFSEPYRPHAWPPGYVLTTEFPIVGIGVCGTSVVVCTEGTPYLVNGISPSTMTLTKINLPEPCLFRGSIISTDTSVLYMSQNGLIQVSSSGQATNVTEQWITRERWQGLTPQKYIRAIKHASAYFAFGTVSGSDTSVAQQGFTVELSPADQVSFTIWPQAGGHRLGFSQLTSPNGFNINNVMVDAWTGIGLLLQNGAVYYYDFTDQAPTIVPYKWRSKVYQQQTKKNFEAFRVFFSVPPGSPTQSVARNTNAVQSVLSAGQYLIVRVYADGTLFTTREVRNTGELLRVLSGVKVEQWQFEMEGIVNVSNMQVATSVKELGLI